MKTNTVRSGLIFELVDCGLRGHAVVGAFCRNCGRSVMQGFEMPGLRMRVQGSVEIRQTTREGKP